MTNHWVDIRNADSIMIVGSNAAENHPISMRWVTKAKENGATVISVDPRFTRSSAVADIYAPMRSGVDVAFFGGLINYALENKLYHEEYVKNYTTAPLLISTQYKFSDGMFSGYDEKERKYDDTTWGYQTDTGEIDPTKWTWADKPGVPKFTIPAPKPAKKDPTLTDSNCVFQIMKKFYSRYDVDTVSKITGMPKEKFEEVAKAYCATGAKGKSGTILYAMGLTQHTNGSQIIRAVAMLQLLLGNMGMAGGGVNALRGESNVQGSTDFALLYHIIPAYMTTPAVDKHPTLIDYLNVETPAGGYWMNKPKFVISLLKAAYGGNATLANNYAYDYLPKLAKGKNYSHIAVFEAMDKGDIKGLFLWGQNPAVGGPNCGFERKAMEKLDWMVAIDLWETETASFWKAPGVKAEEINTEVFLLPAAAHYEKEGSIANSGRWIQWRWKAVEARGEAKSDLWIVDRLYKAIRDQYKKGGKVPEAITNLSWDYGQGEEPDINKVALEINGYTVADMKPVKNFTKLEADGSTACGNWIYSGYFNEAGKAPADQPTGKRDNKDETGIGSFLNWSFAWPVNRRIIYNRASADPSGKPYDPETPVVAWTGSEWKLNDVPDFGAKDPKTEKPIPPDPKKPVAFIMLPEGAGRLFAQKMKDGPLPEHYEPMESPTKNLLSGTQNDPVIKIWESAKLIKEPGSKKYPIVMTTFRVVEHWQTGQMTRNLPWLVEIMPDMFVELSKELAEEKGIKSGDTVVIENTRGAIEAKAVVTDRLSPYKIGDKTVHEIASPWHWGFAACAIGSSANDLTPSVGDANTMIPEYKAFLVNIRKGG